MSKDLNYYLDRPIKEEQPSSQQPSRFSKNGNDVSRDISVVNTSHLNYTNIHAQETDVMNNLKDNDSMIEDEEEDEKTQKTFKDLL